MGERLTSLGAGLKKRRVTLVTFAVVIIAAVVAVLVLGKRSTAANFITARVERGTVELDVSATGTLQAVTTVQVGSQVSGTVSWLGADFKSRVKAGQVVAKLDPAIFQAQVDNSQASLGNAQAAVEAAQTDINNQQANVAAAQANEEAARVARNDAWDAFNRDKEIVNVIATRDLQAAQAVAKQADARLQQATAQIGQAKAALASSTAKLAQSKAAAQQAAAQLAMAKVNLGYTIIKSPIDGVVVSRNVDVGQTVAASLQAPTLFSIANDLRVMQVLASIDEADVGQIREGMDANFSVDAFPGQTFTGKISQIRLNATNTQNVVIYTTVINFSNPDEKLLPGMTANITIPVAKHDNVLMVPNGALRYKPMLNDKEMQELQAKIDAHKNQRDAERQAQADQGAQQQQSDQPPQAALQPQSGSTSMPSAINANERSGRSKMAGGPAGPGAGNGPGSGAGNGPGSGAGPGSAGGGKNTGWSSPTQRPNAGNTSAAAGAPGATGPPGAPAAAPGGAAGPASAGQQRRQGQMIYVLGADGKLDVRFVRVGITNGRVTEIMARDINEGDAIVIGQNEIPNSSNKNSAQNPFQPRPMGGGGPRGR
jgi:HlyD family secretion protein